MSASPSPSDLVHFLAASGRQYDVRRDLVLAVIQDEAGAPLFRVYVELPPSACGAGSCVFVTEDVARRLLEDLSLRAYFDVLGDVTVEMTKKMTAAMQP